MVLLKRKSSIKSVPYPAKLIIEREQIRTENSNKPHGFGLINPNNFSPYPKNPVIAKFFREIGFADELGSGVRNLMKYGEHYGNRTPELIEADVFRIIIGYPNLGRSFDLKAQPYPRPEQQPEFQIALHLEETLQSSIAAKILLAIRKIPLSKSQLAKSLGHVTISGELKKQLTTLLSKEIIEMTYPNNPKNPMQKYRLTFKGLALFEEEKS